MKEIKQAVILAGGQGTRLRPLTLTIPKPMITIHKKPFLSYLVELLKQNGIEEIIILVGFLHERIEEYFGNGDKFGVKIAYSYNPVEADTGTRIREALFLLDDTFLLLYADNFWPLRLEELASFYHKKGKQALVTVYSNFDHATKSNIRLDSNNIVEVYDRTRKNDNLNGVDIGFFILSKRIFNDAPKENFSFEDVILPDLIKRRELVAFLTHHKYYGLSTHERIPLIEDYFQEKKVVFLDRDGVINKRPPKAEYVKAWEEFIFLPKAQEALKILKKKGYLMYLISSQAGIARGVITRKQVDAIHERLQKELSRNGIRMEGIYMCPHGWDEECFCRKPSPGLFFQAAAQNHVDLYESYCIGDDPRDIIAGRLAGCKTIFITSNKNKTNFSKGDQPDRIVKSLYEAALTMP